VTRPIRPVSIGVQIYKLLSRRKGGLTEREIEQRIGCRYSTVRSALRIFEGLCFERGPRRACTVTGRKAMTWQAGGRLGRRESK